MKENYINIFEVFTKKLTNWINELIDKTPNITIATVLFILGFYLSGVVKNWL